MPIYRKRTHPFSFVIAIALCLLCAVGLFAAYNLYTAYDEEHRAALEKPVQGTAEYSFDYAWADVNPYVAHAMGGILGQTYTNSSEAFLLNYSLGHRVFEVDLSLTEDGRTVLTHDANTWKSRANIPTGEESKTAPAKDAAFTYNNFVSSLWYDKYHTLDVEGLLALMRDHPDAYVMTDSKFFDEEHVRTQFTEIVQAAQAMDPALLDRFIVSVYTPDMLGWVMDIYPWKSVVCSLYRDWANWTPEKVTLFLQDSGIKMVCLPADRASDELLACIAAEGASPLVFTVNSLTTVEGLEEKGVGNYVTDYLYVASPATAPSA